MSYDITIGTYKVNNVLAVKITKNCDQLSDTCVVELPAQAYNAALEVESKLKRGNFAQVSVGYNGNNNLEFEGYVFKIETDDKIIIHLEDAMFLLRKPIKNREYKAVKLSALMDDVVAQINAVLPVGSDKITVSIDDAVKAIGYEKFTIDNQATAWEVMRKVQENWKVNIFLRGAELFVQAKYTDNLGVVVYDFSENVEKNALKYRKSEDKQVQVEVIGVTRQNKKVSVIVGKEGGDKITLHRYNITDEAALKLIGEEELKKHSYTGYEGTITTWLVPYATYGNRAKIIDELYPEREGTYYVEAVTTTFSSSGGVRELSLGVKVD